MRRRDQLPLAAGFTLVELLVAVAMLVIGLGLMVSLARHVRSASATDVTRELLRTLGGAVETYWQREKAPPTATPLLTAADAAVQAVGESAARNNRDLIAVLRAAGILSRRTIDDLPATQRRGDVLRDAWGSPVVLMPRFDPAIGMALDDRPFVFSAGPDRDYLTREDNLYSYEQLLPTDPAAPEGERKVPNRQ